jgi:hypothetical protein
MKETAKTFPKGVDKLTALMDMLAGWQHKIAVCLDYTDEDLAEMGKTRNEWEKHHNEDYLQVAFDLYQASGELMELPEDEQDKAVETFVRECLLRLFKI